MTTVDEVRRAAHNCKLVCGRDTTIAIIRRFGAEKLTDVRAEDYHDIVVSFGRAVAASAIDQEVVNLEANLERLRNLDIARDELLAAIDEGMLLLNKPGCALNESWLAWQAISESLQVFNSLREGK